MSKTSVNENQLFEFIGTDSRTEKPTEKIINGKIVSDPITTFVNVDWDKREVKQGFLYKVEIVTLMGYEYKSQVLNVLSVFDITKWELLRKGDLVELSIVRKETSRYSDDGNHLKCNVVSRKRR